MRSLELRIAMFLSFLSVRVEDCLSEIHQVIDVLGLWSRMRFDPLLDKGGLRVNMPPPIRFPAFHFF